jgi:hypothetical protein
MRCSLAAVNFFLFLANGYQFGRLLNYNYFSDKKPIKEDVKDAGKDAKASIEQTAETVKSAVSSK